MGVGIVIVFWVDLELEKSWRKRVLHCLERYVLDGK